MGAITLVGGVGVVTLGDGVVLGWCVGNSCTTLGACVLMVDFSSVGFGLMSSTRFNCVASSKSALRTGSPAFKLGTVFCGGRVNIVTMSVAACFK